MSLKTEFVNGIRSRVVTYFDLTGCKIMLGEPWHVTVRKASIRQTPNPGVHLTRGSQTLTITRLSGRYPGLINGKPYIEALRPEEVAPYLVEAPSSDNRA